MERKVEQFGSPRATQQEITKHDVENVALALQGFSLVWTCVNCHSSDVFVTVYHNHYSAYCHFCHRRSFLEWVDE